MTLQQTIGELSTVVNKPQAKSKVKEVKDEQRFSNVRETIAQMVAASTDPTAKARDNAIAFQVRANGQFGRAVTRRLRRFIREGD